MTNLIRTNVLDGGDSGSGRVRCRHVFEKLIERVHGDWIPLRERLSMCGCLCISDVVVVGVEM